MAKKSKIGVSELLKRNRIKRRGRHSKKHKGYPKASLNQNAAFRVSYYQKVQTEHIHNVYHIF
jgi:hypothetical protein